MNKKEKKLIIFTHGRLGTELVEVAQLIFGKIQEGMIVAVSNSQLSLTDSLARLRELTCEENDYIIFTDFPGGSCFMAAKKLSSQQENLHTISGANISMVLSFVTKNDKFDIAELVRVIKNDGNRAIY